MKKYILSLTVLVIAGFVFTGCVDNDIFVPKDTPPVFRFQSGTVAVAEVRLDADKNPIGTGITQEITVVWHKQVLEAGEITLQVAPRGNVQAVEGTDYTISTKTLSFAADEYQKKFSITTIYDPTYTGTKQFTITIASSTVSGARLGAFGAAGTCVVSINDVDHPLVALIGNVKLKATQYYTGNIIKDAIITPDDEDDKILWLTTNLRTDDLNTKMKMEVKDNGDEYELSIKFPILAGRWDATRTAYWYATYWIDAEDDWDVTLSDHTIVGKTKKDEINIEFDGGFVQFVQNNETGAIAGYSVDYIVPRTLVISK